MSAADQLREIMDRRIAIHDGSWGVLIHRKRLSEADYRGERLRDHGRDVQGDPDLLDLTPPEIISERSTMITSRPAPTSPRRTPSPATSIGLAGCALEGLAPAMRSRRRETRAHRLRKQ